MTETAAGTLAPFDLSHDPRLEPLFELNERLSALVRSWVSHPLGDEHRTAAQWMVLFALGKAYKTHGAIIELCRRGYGEDAAVLLRTLLELSIDVRYISLEPEGERVERWLDYDWVTRYQFLRTFHSDTYFSDAQDALHGKESTVTDIEREAKRVQERWKFWRVDKRTGAWLTPKHWSGRSTAQLAKKIGWESSYAVVYAMTSLLAHSGIRSANDYLEESADGTLTVSATPSARWVDRVIATAPIYLVEIAKDWCKLLHAPDDAVKALAAIQGEVSGASTEPLDPTAQHPQ